MAQHLVIGGINMLNSGTISNLSNGVAAQDAATVSQLNQAVEGLSWKDNVRAGAAVNVNLAAPGASIGGVTMAANDRFLALGQTAGAENGIYIFNGAATPATRSPDASTFDELKNATVTVDEGTAAGTTYRQSVVAGTLGTTALSFGSFGTAAPAASTTVAGIVELATQAEVDGNTGGSFAVTSDTFNANKVMVRPRVFSIGDGTATTFNCDHNLNTVDVQVQVVRSTGNRENVIVDIMRPTVNRVTIPFPPSYVPATNEFRVIIQGVLS
jgi:hypothetical protein